MAHVMPFPYAATLLALTLSGAARAQDEEVPSGFEALATDPFAAGVFEELAVASGAPARVLAHTVHGSVNDAPFVNVMRWADARAYRGQLIALTLPVRLDAPSLDTSARLWVRVLRADGTVAFEDDGLDSASSSTEWTTLASIGAVAEDATDLCFGLVVQGQTQVRMRDFELEVRGAVASLDERHAVPERWARDPDVRNAYLTDSAEGHSARVTSFLPAGHAVEDLPHLWLLREDGDLRQSYVAGRALLEAMRLTQDPPAIVSFVHPGPNTPRRSILGLLQQSESELPAGSMQLVASASDEEAALVLFAASEAAGMEDAAAALEEHIVGEGDLHAERVLMRWMCARHDSGGDAQLAGLLFDASLETMAPWAMTSLVQQSSHSLAGHDCGHDHAHDHAHDHNH